MAKNTIQEERMRRYFIDATKEILKGEGLKSVNVRSIAEKAGYSFATIYNYFRDVKDLVYECVKDFLEECAEIVKQETESIPSGKEKIKALTKSYIKYFVQYPGTFELFFIEKPHNLAGKQTTIEMIDSFYEKLCSDQWDYIIQKGDYTAEEAKLKQSQLNYTVLGILLLYINRRQPSSYTDFNAEAEKQINLILS
jgi:AcrR family transcriptional regulator